ncbi:sulfite reductase [Aestuarium zhoushanense]|jgi:hypothetical protein|uniref:DUF2849 domain-containing protein n=1 Tax=Marivivens donghaensis TaxID=1699413 RepID=UPI000CA29898|nr:DUF2849 domain-containing protein [Marivivens donghaensis]AUJ64245.1 sulfite reductase [Aestuarium zhoushanense]MCL7408900.1 DUF2849 domain-containing protein [Marivivens donghaensis]MDN3703802.1 DUF2849 domain-containing protein [Marivivens donghaensis]
MSRRFTPKVITANLLLDGDAVWLTADDRWSKSMLDAELIEDEAHADIRILFANGQANIVVGPYLADAKAGPNGPEPTHFREEFRTRGPSNYAHGKQVELN